MTEEKKEQPEKVPKKRLTPAQWAEIKALWESGEVTLADLSQKYNASKEAFSAMFKRKGIVKGSKAEAIHKAIEHNVLTKVVGRTDMITSRIHDTKEQYYAHASALQNITMKLITDAYRDKKNLTTLQGQLKSLKIASDILGNTMDARYRVLGMDKDEVIDENELVQLPIIEMSNEKIEEIKKEADERAGLGFDDNLPNIGAVIPEPEQIIEDLDESDDDLIIIDDDSED